MNNEMEKPPEKTHQKVISYIRYFFLNSTIHGFNHIANPDKSIISNCFWVMLVSLAVYGAIILSSETLTRYSENPTVVSMERDRFSWNTSFPGETSEPIAATICPSFKINEKALADYVAISTTKNKTKLELFLRSLSEATFSNFESVVDFDAIPAKEFLPLMLKLKFPFTPSVTSSGTTGINNYLNEIIAEMGLCYSFNSQLALYNSPSYWLADNWKLFPENDTFSVNPLDGEVFANVVNMSSGFQPQIPKPLKSVDIHLTYIIDISIMQMKKLKPKSAICDYLHSFLSTSNIHGFYHIADRSRQPLETLLWICFVMIGACGALFLSLETLERYFENPTVVSIDKNIYAWNISFPAVTVCPDRKIEEEHLERIVNNISTSNRTLLKKFLMSLSEATFTNFENVEDSDAIDSENYKQILLDLMPTFGPAVSSTGLSQHDHSVTEIVTERGVCYCFNSLLSPYLSRKYLNTWEVLSENETFNVNILDGQVYAHIMGIGSGYNVYVHGPYEVVDIASKSIYSPNGYFLQLYLSGLTLFSSERTRNLGINQRKCRFYYESNLKHSPVYSYVLCRMECRAALCQSLCGCIPHFYRKLDGEKVCDVKGLRCLAKHKERLIVLEGECSCLANCDEVTYVVEDMDTREWFLGSNLQWGLKEYPKMRLKRDVLFGFSDLLVYIGGMAGLFLGCSVLSFIEIIYFFTLRLLWFVVNYGEESKKMQKELAKYLTKNEKHFLLLMRVLLRGEV